MAVSNPQQLAQQYKGVLQSQGYVVGSDGTVRLNGAAVPPWSWAQAVPELQAQKVNVQGSQLSPYTLPPGFAESAWSGMKQDNGPFSLPAQWDQQTGTYESKPDWWTIGGTAGVGTLFAAPVLAGALGGGSSTAAASAGAGSGAGAGTATAGGAGVATTSAGSGWFTPSSLISPIIQGVATAYGANQQANANEEAAKLQYQSTEEALKDARDQRAYQQQQYANYLGRLEPYLSLGTNAGSTLQNLLARSPYTRTANQGPLPTYSTAPQQQAPQPMTQAPSGSPAMNTASGQSMVTLKAPDGSQKQVSADQAQHYIGLGAVPV